jgi:four helix bundle protein
MKPRILSHAELHVYRNAMGAAMEIFEITRDFPRDERFSMIDQIRRSSRSVCANIAEAWRKRRCSAAFVAKLNDSESEATETQVWLEFAVRCGYLSPDAADELGGSYNQIIGQLVRMLSNPEHWRL